MKLAKNKQPCEAFVACLAQYAPIYNSSLMQNYPDSLQNFPDEFSALESDLLSMQSFCHSVNRAPLESPKIAASLHTNSDNSFNGGSGISDKKRHELDALLALLCNHTKPEERSQPVIDWGGGKGHLAAYVQAHTEHPVLVLDKESELLSHYQHLNYLEATIERGQELPSRLKPILASPHGSMGLHACGSLSITQMEHAANSHCQWLINVPCCFEKMQESHKPLSTTLAHLPALSPAALNLATRTSKDQSEDNLALKKAIHDFRWTIFLFEHHELVEKGLVTQTTRKLGRFSPTLYRKGFSAYLQAVVKKIPHLQRYESDLLTFYQSKSCQSLLAETYLLQQWRNQLARPLELAVVLDRGFWLQENQFEVHVERLFDSTISPRNFTIRARRL